METITPIEFMALSRFEVIKRCETYLKEFNGGKQIKIKNPMDCPIAQWVAYNGAKCHRQMIPNTATCPICGSPVCPDCMNHLVVQLSRVTGYLSTVSGWNESKKQEFEDRNRYSL
jgi:hypothetical protein